LSVTYDSHNKQQSFSEATLTTEVRNKDFKAGKLRESYRYFSGVSYSKWEPESDEESETMTEK
jgi:hypothetical protein